MPAGATVVLDNLSLTSTGGLETALYSRNKAKLEIKGSTTLIEGFVYNGGEMTLSDGTITGNLQNNGSIIMTGGIIDSKKETRQTVANQDTGTFAMSGGIIKKSEGYMYGEDSAFDNRGKLTISGNASIVGGRTGVVLSSSSSLAELTMTGGTVESSGSAIEIKLGKLDISGGTVKGLGNYSYGVWLSCNDNVSAFDTNIAISGGSVTSKGLAAVCLVNGGTTTISNSAEIEGEKSGIIINDGASSLYQSAPNAVTISGGSIITKDTTAGDEYYPSAALLIGKASKSTVTITDGVIKPANSNTIILRQHETTDSNASVNLFGSSFYRSSKADIVITGDGTPHILSKPPITIATVEATNFKSGSSFDAWTKNSEKTEIINNALNPATFVNLTNGNNAVYLKVLSETPDFGSNQVRVKAGQTDASVLINNSSAFDNFKFKVQPAADPAPSIDTLKAITGTIQSRPTRTAQKSFCQRKTLA